MNTVLDIKGEEEITRGGRTGGIGQVGVTGVQLLTKQSTRLGSRGRGSRLWKRVRAARQSREF